MLARYNPNQPHFLKTKWSAEGMGQIIIQSTDNIEFTTGTKLRLAIGECKFDLTEKTCLRPPSF